MLVGLLLTPGNGQGARAATAEEIAEEITSTGESRAERSNHTNGIIVHADSGDSTFPHENHPPPENQLGAAIGAILPIATQAVNALVNWIHPETVSHGLERIQQLYGKKGSKDTINHITAAFDNENNGLLAAQLAIEIENSQTNFEALQIQKHEMELHEIEARKLMNLLDRFRNIGAKTNNTTRNLFDINCAMIAIALLTVAVSAAILVILLKYYRNFKTTQRAFNARKLRINDPEKGQAPVAGSSYDI